ncbi:TPA: HNH endonuclease [Vibrio parahaemolyticus]|nr:HNH endonuclease [Vibrio parahaemolyticus]HCH4282099.1 HNH endonuclease [Vibrio parahaemolyticus]
MLNSSSIKEAALIANQYYSNPDFHFTPNTNQIIPVPDYDGYYVTNTGNVLSLKQHRPRWLSPTRAGNYLKICLSNHEGRKQILLHRLVANAFIPNPHNKPEVNHIDEDPLNNHVTNLEWCTSQENCEHSFASESILLCPEGKEVHVRNIKQFSLAQGLNPDAMTRLISGKSKTSQGWKLVKRIS